MNADEFFGITYRVYLHKTLKDNKLFYVGLAKFKARAYDIKGRNNFWYEIAKDGFIVEIVKNNLSKKEAYELERELINTYGKLIDNTGILANIK